MTVMMHFALVQALRAGGVACPVDGIAMAAGDSVDARTGSNVAVVVTTAMKDLVT